MSRPAYITLSIVTTFLRCLEYKVPHNCLLVIHEVHGFSTVLFHIFDNAPASYPDLISVLPDDQVVRLHFPAIVIQKQIYSKIPLKSLSACSDTSTSYIISHNPCECPQKLSSHFLSVQPAYPHILSPILH